MDIEYDYNQLTKAWSTGELEEQESSYKQSKSIRFTYVYEDGDWVLVRLDDLGI